MQETADVVVILLADIDEKFLMIAHWQGAEFAVFFKNRNHVMLLCIVIMDLRKDDFDAFFFDHIVNRVCPPAHGAHPVFLHTVDG